MHKENHELIQTLLDCAQSCDHCAVACLDEDYVKMMARCIKLDIDCADMCYMSARMLTRGSELTKQHLQMCADMCKLCGDECEKHKHMEHCKECAEACRRCEEACRNYSK